MPNRPVYYRKGHYTIKITFSSEELGLMKYYDGSIVDLHVRVSRSWIDEEITV